MHAPIERSRQFVCGSALATIMACLPGGAEAQTATLLDEISVEGGRNARRGAASASGGSSLGRDSRGIPPTGTVGQPPPPYAGGQVATGSRIGILGNRPLLQTPFSASSYTEKLIADQQALSVADVTLNDPSVRADSPAFSERDSFFIRGFSVTNLDTAYDSLFYINNPRRMQLEGIERVEVLKGPTALLSGGVGRVGGTINLIPKRAYDEPLTRITTSYFSRGHVGTHLDVGRRFGTFKEWGVRFNGSYRNGQTALNKNEIEVGNASLGLDYRGDRLRASLDLVHFTQNITAPTSLFNAANPGIVIPRAPNGRINTANAFEYNDSRYEMAATRVEYDILPNVTIYGAAGISRYREDSLSSYYTITASNGDATNALAIAPTGLEGYTGEVGLRANVQTGWINHRFTVAAVEADNKNFSRGYFPPLLPSYATNIYNPTYLPFGSVPNLFPRASEQPLFTEINLRSVAVADTMSLGDDRVLLTLGGRWQEVALKSYVTRPVPTQGDLASSYLEGRFSPAIALAIRPFDNLTLYGNYIEALTEGPTAPSVGVSNPGQVFPPVVSRQKEIGAKYDFGTVALTAALFEIEQPSAFTSGGTFSVDGLQRNSGVELSLFGELAPGLRLLGGVTFLDAVLARTERGLFDGRAVPGVPTTALTLYGEYDLPPWLAPGLTMTGRIVYADEVFFDRANTQVISDWTRVDAGLRYVFEGVNGKPVVMRAAVQNIFDEAYWATAARGFLSVGAPRTFILSASVDF